VTTGEGRQGRRDSSTRQGQRATVRRSADVARATTIIGRRVNIQHGGHRCGRGIARTVGFYGRLLRERWSTDRVGRCEFSVQLLTTKSIRRCGSLQLEHCSDRAAADVKDRSEQQGAQ